MNENILYPTLDNINLNTDIASRKEFNDNKYEIYFTLINKIVFNAPIASIIPPKTIAHIIR